MPGIETAEQAIKAEAICSRLEAKVKAGTTTEEERVRYGDLLDYILIWDWQQQEKTYREQRARAQRRVA